MEEEIRTFTYPIRRFTFPDRTEAIPAAGRTPEVALKETQAIA